MYDLWARGHVLYWHISAQLHGESIQTLSNRNHPRLRVSSLAFLATVSVPSLRFMSMMTSPTARGYMMVVILLAFMASDAFYLLYHLQCPSFIVSSVYLTLPHLKSSLAGSGNGGWELAMATGTSRPQKDHNPVKSIPWEKSSSDQKIIWDPNFIFETHLLKTLGDSLLFFSQYLLGSCKTTWFGEKKLRYSWRCS